MITRKTPPFLLFLVAIGMASCSKPDINPGTGKDLVLTGVEQQEVAADNAFTLSLFKNLNAGNTDNSNIFMSPLSVGFALGMTSNGANGETLAAIKSTLHFKAFSQSDMNSYYKDLITGLPALDPNTTLTIANSIWYRNTFSVLPQFLQTNSSYYNAEIQGLDFTSASAVGTINNWVDKKTNGKIPTIINSINADAVMYLINAMYFKSAWKEKFDAAKTAKLPFFLTDNSQVQTDFMDSKIDFNRYDDTTADIFELPYSNSKYSLVILMPASGTTVQQLAATIDSAKWVNWMSKLYPANDELKMPKFKFSYSVDLNDALKALGMSVAFSNQADFSGINNTIPLQITDVTHKAYIDVDETGTTAAAATSVTIGISAVLNAPPTIIDHPFIFAIRQMSSGLVLFAGVVNNPLQAQ